MTYALNILRAERDRKAAELEAAQVVVRELRSAVREMDEAIAALCGNSPASSGARTLVEGTLKSVVVEIITETPDLVPAQIVSALAARGRKTDHNTVLGTLSRARRDGLVHKVGRGWRAGESRAHDVLFEESEAPATAEASFQFPTPGNPTGAVQTPEKASEG